MSLRLTEEEFAALMARRGTPSVSYADSSPFHKGEPATHQALRASSPCAGEPKRAKYGNKRVVVDGKRFDSQHEAEVYGELMLRYRAGELRLVLRQVPFDLPGGIRYIADFVVFEAGGRLRVLDAKSEATRKDRVYINKKKQVLSEWGIEIEEV